MNIIFENNDITIIIRIFDDKIFETETWRKDDNGQWRMTKNDIVINNFDAILAEIKDFKKRHEILTFHYCKTRDFKDFYVELNGNKVKAFSI